MASISALINGISYNFMYSPSPSIHLIFNQPPFMFLPWLNRIMGLESTNLVPLIHFFFLCGQLTLLASKAMLLPMPHASLNFCDLWLSTILWRPNLSLLHTPVTSISPISSYLHTNILTFITSCNASPSRCPRGDWCSIKGWKILYYWPEHRILAFIKVLSLMKAL